MNKKEQNIRNCQICWQTYLFDWFWICNDCWRNVFYSCAWNDNAEEVLDEIYNIQHE